MDFKDEDYQTIYCPWCGRKVGRHHKRSSMNKYCVCKKCDKEVVFDCVSGETYIRNRRERNTSSGMTFI